MTAKEVAGWSSHLRAFAIRVLVWPAAGLVLFGVMLGEYTETKFDGIWAFVVLMTFAIAGWKIVLPLRSNGYRAWKLSLMLFVTAVVSNAVIAYVGDYELAADRETVLGVLILVAAGFLGGSAAWLLSLFRTKS